MIISKYLRVFFLLTGLFLAFSLAKLIFFIALPMWGTFPHVYLPEDFLFCFIYSLGEELITAYPAIAVSTIVLTFSFWLKESELVNNPQTGHPRIKTLIKISTLLILSAAAFSSLSLFAQPWLESHLQTIEYKAQMTKALEASYLELKTSDLTAGTLEEKIIQEKKLTILQRLAILRPSQRSYSKNEKFDYEFEIQILNSHLQLEEFFMLRTLPGVDREKPFINRSVQDLLDLAQEKLKGKDPDDYGANVLAYQVFKRLINHESKEVISEKQLALAKLIIDQSWSAIYAKTLSNDERLKASYFFRKGKSLGDFQFQNYLEAYYGFSELHKENPSDEEVSRHLDLSREKVKATVLFSQEMEVLFVAPGFQNIVFRHPDPRLNKKGQQEVIRIAKLLDTAQGVFVKGFELLRFDQTGQVLLHWKAPFGKWTDKGLDFRVWDKELPENHFPTVLKETPGNVFMEEGAIDPPLYVINFSYKDLETLQSTQSLPRSIETGLLMLQGDSIASLGASPLPLQTEFFLRIFGAFGCLTLFFAVFFFSWILRAQHFGKKIPPLWRVLIVLLPPVMSFMLDGLAWGSRLLAAGMIDTFDFTTAGIAVITVCSVSLVTLLIAIWIQLKKTL